ncbi:threonine--tRNA ligase [Pelobacter propionicus]|uniref:Threonine--tRNA ligase n=1 Tax=Pelobacter propionicus (strain DSM 2379 / NBRC 103807 / OttBd1) TaxID=338966 RepID=SYT_PELPD|nr:threonine--tRNA ligase [Pelobacter propionicus]A1ARE5.1 RecName: Full=Threonine--tRNA ligase; AltName: Full=Threonyl-tRNA synthetase; Short=ThrRS [Pelobacter propionicus DSM 2379]ABK99915.1 Ser-tRNA(Thr) hydrolase [Pelobacter propionicus DSM 2379]
MSSISIALPDGSKREIASGSTIADLAASIGAGLAKAAIAGKLDGELVDLSTELKDDSRVEIITEKSPEALTVIRHSAAHLMAQAVKELFPQAKVTIGPAIESGFYYDFDMDAPFTPEDLERIEARMAELAAANQKIERRVLSSSEAVSLFSGMGENYKVELINDLAAETVSVYSQGDFADLCRGPHLPSTSRIKAFKLLSIAGAYWRGDEKNRMLQRIYGTAFADKKELEAYLHRLEESKRRDHRRLGRELDLFSFSDEVGAGLVIWHPKGAMLRTILEDFERREHLKRGYDIVLGPQILKKELWQRSGHYENYRENMYFTEVDEQSYGIKPMNCLAHMMIYKSHLRSYRDLPLRYFELGTVHRHERAGVLHGLLRVRGFTQDDAHILCAPEQLDGEIKGVLKFVSDVMAIFGFEYEMELSTRPEKSIGDDAAWELATEALLSALKDTGRSFEINEGDGAFYGPKIDIKLKDALDRRWQCATIQCDFTLPERFDLQYVAADGEKKRPVMVHRVVLGAIERFIGVLIEHYAGNFPLWLSPVQAMLVTVTDNHIPYAQGVLEHLREAGIRVQGDFRNEKLSFKIREAQLQKVPYMLVIGDKEMESATVTPRFRDGKNLVAMKPEDFVAFVVEETKNFR